MVRNRSPIFFSLIYLAVASISIILFVIDSPVQSFAFAAVMGFCAPWSSVILFIFSWAMNHNDEIFRFVVGLFFIAALINSVIIFFLVKIIASIRSKSSR